MLIAVRGWAWGQAFAVLTLLLSIGFLVWLFSVGPYRNIALSAEASPVAYPPVLGPFEADPAITDREAWRRRRAPLLRAFEEQVYGPLPKGGAASVARRVHIPPAEAGGVEGVEQWEIELEGVGRFNLVLVLPASSNPVPTIIMQSYCGNRAAFPGRPAAIATPLQFYPRICRSSAVDPFHHALMGRWINGPPFELVARRGYALAIFYGGDIVPDRAPDAEAALAAMGYPETGAIAAWAWMYSRALDVLQTDVRLDPDRMIAWGQSRYGKAALLAGAMDERFSAIVALQSGRGGDALTRHRAGESVASLTESFPHWFSPRFNAYAERDPPIDQHQLLALIAPRPLLLGHARRDGWADPMGARAALDGARPVFDLLAAPQPTFFIRDGQHGVVSADWETTLDFLDDSATRSPGR